MTQGRAPPRTGLSQLPRGRRPSGGGGLTSMGSHYRSAALIYWRSMTCISCSSSANSSAGAPPSSLSSASLAPHSHLGLWERGLDCL